MVVADDDKVSFKISFTHNLIEIFLIVNISNNSMMKYYFRVLM